jgi:hypothetical protein
LSERAGRLATNPTATIHATPEIVWALLTEPAAYPRWAGRVLRVDPPGSATAGQRIDLGERLLGLPVRVPVEVVSLQESPRRLRLEMRLPFGIVQHELVSCASLGEESVFVSFNGDFELPPGWRGTLVSLLFGRALLDAPAGQLARLRRAAEALQHEHEAGGHGSAHQHPERHDEHPDHEEQPEHEGRD